MVLPRLSAMQKAQQMIWSRTLIWCRKPYFNHGKTECNYQKSSFHSNKSSPALRPAIFFPQSNPDSQITWQCPKLWEVFVAPVISNVSATRGSAENAWRTTQKAWLPNRFLGRSNSSFRENDSSAVKKSKDVLSLICIQCFFFGLCGNFRKNCASIVVNCKRFLTWIREL